MRYQSKDAIQHLDNKKYPALSQTLDGLDHLYDFVFRLCQPRVTILGMYLCMLLYVLYSLGRYECPTAWTAEHFCHELCLQMSFVYTFSVDISYCDYISHIRGSISCCGVFLHNLPLDIFLKCLQVSFLMSLYLCLLLQLFWIG